MTIIKQTPPNLTNEGRAFLQERFAQRGFEYIPSVANFVLVRVGNGKEVFQKFLKGRMIIRAINEYK
jgi:histidinol-phosphate aminotransferase